MNIFLADGSAREFTGLENVTVLDVATAISSGLKKRAVAGKINGQPANLSDRVFDQDVVQILTLEDAAGLEVYRHTAAHVLGQALMRLYPETQLAIGPVIEHGFYYDFTSSQSLSQEDLPRIQAEMEKIIAENLAISFESVSRAEALQRFADNTLKTELIRELSEDQNITIYHQGEFSDLCRGPHLISTGKIKAFQLLSIAGAYWRGDSDRQMLQRIYGTAWPKKADLATHLQDLEEAKLRDHRKLGKELDIFMLSKVVGQGLPTWLPKGATLRRLIERYIVDLEESLGYEHVYTPHLANIELYKISGHWEHYHEDMYPSMKVDQ